MAHDTKEGLQSLLDGGCMYLCRIFRLTRRDGTVYRLVDHNAKIKFHEGFLDGSADLWANDEEYTPTDGVNASASRQEAGLRASSMEFAGVFSSSLITNADLRAGLFDECKLDVAWVDWRYPWLGAFRHNVLRLTDFEYDNEKWSVQATNLMSELRRKFGRQYGRTCWHAFMDDGCGIAKTGGTTTFSAQAVTSIVDADVNFRFDEGTSSEQGNLKADNYFRAGHLKWLTGNNAGKIYPIKKSFIEVGGGGGSNDARIVLQFPTRADIQVGDTFNLIAGCDKLIESCQSTTLAGGVNNHENFGGFPHMPGTSKVVQAGQLNV